MTTDDEAESTESGEEPDMSPEDEAALDRAWAKHDAEKMRDDDEKIDRKNSTE